MQGGKPELAEAVSFTIATPYRNYGPASDSTVQKAPSFPVKGFGVELVEIDLE